MKSPIKHPDRLGTKKTLVAAAILTVCGSSSTWAQTVEDSAKAFTLGTVVVRAGASQDGEIGEDQVASLVTQKEMQQYNRDNIADALNLLSGISISHGQKNERRVSIRGFESSKAGLYIDGIPVYIPYDGAVDMNRFVTADLAAIQVAKGFTSMAYGPNAMSGVINLVTRRPVKAFEGDVMLGVGEGNERRAQVNVGSNQGLWYIQGGAAHLESDYFRMSSDFTANQYEDGGHRNNSYRKDQKISFKIGVTPNATDEYALSYIKQDGEKGQPTSTIRNMQFWKWPYWNKESFYLNTRTALGAKETLKIKLYHDTFDNAIDMYKDRTFTTINGTGPSIYNDKTDGGSIELESTRIKDNTLRLFAFYKKDSHDKNDYSGTLAKFDRMEDTLTSFAVENNYQIHPDLLLSVGAAHHELKPDRIWKSDAAPGTLNLPNAKTANDAQAGLFYDWSANARLYATVAKKTRLPSLIDRYNTGTSKSGTRIENPGLRPERAMNYEIGYQGTPWQGVKAEAALFYSEVEDKIQEVLVTGTTYQNQNIGKVKYPGIELGLSTRLSSQFELGGNFTWLDPKNVSNPKNKITDVPKRKLTLHALYQPSNAIDVVAFVENASNQWDFNYVELGNHTTLNLKVAYRPMKAMTLEVGVNNATDVNYAFQDGFPQPGRMWFANARYQF
ncbi:TonB-dependent receptor [Denitratisoma sp. DHT3]|uniref:TonB-dependent receptor plug domain-containing protein n=1 Tax=Denitratisoma sp. DHT3 TaxID=1981880 RepID=UPI0011984772|nr:TonB-dependent receptor [Denitratisoma sp. DHT3]QDX80543.1 TonB-dependent receptor [Denitratisoma sp. DHT3]